MQLLKGELQGETRESSFFVISSICLCRRILSCEQSGQRGRGYLSTLSFRVFMGRIEGDRRVVAPRKARSPLPQLLSQITHFGAMPWPSCFSNLKTGSCKSFCFLVAQSPLAVSQIMSFASTILPSRS